MEEQSTIFETRLKELITFANGNKGVIDNDKVNDFFKEMNLSIAQIDHMYEYLEANNITVLSTSDDEPDDDALLELDDDDIVLEAEDLSAIANAMADDPVKQYLKEIGVEISGFVKSVCSVTDEKDYPFEALDNAKKSRLF